MLNFCLFIVGVSGLFISDYFAMTKVNKFGVSEFDSYLKYIGFLIMNNGIRIFSFLLIIFSICWTIVNSIKEIKL